MSRPSRPKTSEYTILGDALPPTSFFSRLKHPTLLKYLINVLCLLFVVGVSYSVGRHTAPAVGVEPEIPLASEDRVFQYNRTFAEGTKRSAEAWESFFPPKNGYFTHPSIAPERSTLSVYQNLYCLNGIRAGYWKVHGFAVTGVKMNESELPMTISPPHVRHCLDLLRQSLMCYPDTTFEKKDEEAGGVHGFGTMHRCKKWDALLEWTAGMQESERILGIEGQD